MNVNIIKRKKINYVIKLIMDSWQLFLVIVIVEFGSFRKVKIYRKKVIVFSDRIYRIMSD